MMSARGSVLGLVSTLCVVVGALLLTSSPAALASEGCENEARRVEQASTFLPDCRAYELVSQPSQPTPYVTAFLAFEGVPSTLSTQFSSFPDYSPEPRVLSHVQENAFTALDGHAVAYKGEEPNAESYETEDPINLSRRTPEGWRGENVLPPQSAHSGYGCNGTRIEAVPPSLTRIAVRLGGGNPGLGEDYLHCSHDEPYLFTEAEGESREVPSLALRSGAMSSWSLVSIYPPGVTTYDPGASGSGITGLTYAQYNPILDAVSADGTAGVFASQAQLTADAPNGETINLDAEGVDGHCANEFGNVYFWSAGVDRVLTVPPDAIPVRGTLAGAHAGNSAYGGCLQPPQQTAGFTNSLAADGQRALFYAGGGFEIDPGTFSTAPRAPYVDGGLFLRVRPGSEQSALAHGGAAGAGALTAGSDSVTALRVTLAAGVGHLASGSAEVTELATLTGKFAVGQTLEGQGLPAGTTITEITERTRTLAKGTTESYPVIVLSNKASESVSTDKLAAVSAGPAPFAVGQTITGNGIPAGTTITAIAPGSLTLSGNATASAAAVSLEGSSECTEPAKACTVQIDAPQAGASGAPGGGQFQWANAETTKIFLTDDQKLTVDSTAESGKPDLYEYDVEKPQAQRLTDLTVDASAVANVLGVSGASEDGSYVYFVADGVLAENENTHHAKAALGKANLYMRHGGTATFIATLDAEGGDQCDWTAWCLTARVSQNGEYIAFDSIDPITGYDNTPVKPTACNFLITEKPGSTAEDPCMEAYRYAAASGAHGELTCATCNPRGRPEAEFSWAIVPQAYRQGPVTGGYQVAIDHPMANTGQFFFETEEALVAADENGVTHNSVDVYEYAGGEETTAQYHLISTGKSGTASEFLGASADGSNVFISTAESLVRADTRNGYDIYDVRVNGGFASQNEQVLPPACKGEGDCRSPLSEAPAQSSAGSAALFGAGDLAPPPQQQPSPPVNEQAKKPPRRQMLERALRTCRGRYRHKPKRRVGCERTAHKRYSASKKGTSK
jgi:hypothetical protein